MSPVLTEVTGRKIFRPSNLRPCLRARWFVLATIFFLVPLHAIAAVSITVGPSAVNLTPNATQQFAATVTGSSETLVIWTIQEGASGGTVTGSGLYSAPGAVGVYHVVATSHADPAQSAIATVGVPGFIHTGLLYRGPCTSTLLANGTILYTGGGVVSGSASANAEIYDPVTSKSTSTGNMNVPRCSGTATLLPNGKVLFAGGASTGQTATAELYDPVAGTFTTTGSMSVARSGHTATLLSTGKVLIVGGSNCSPSCVFVNTSELYDPSSGTFSPTGNPVVAASNSVATLLPNGKVLIAGGFTASTSSTGTAVAELYDPATGLFAQTGSMINLRELDFTATLLQSGKVLIAGGIGNGAAESAAEVYDPSAGTFSQTGSLSTPLFGQTATLLSNGKVLIAGGSSTFTTPIAAELYDPVAGTFSPTGSLQEPRTSASATRLANGTVLIAGGNGGSTLGSVEVYDPSLGVFTSQSTFMNIGRTGNTMTKLADGRFIFIGGLGLNGMALPAEIYDPATNKFTLTGSLANAREMHTATLLGNGKVLVVGGFTAPSLSTFVSSAELYDPVAGTFGPAPSNPNINRADHTATLLQNGKVLIAGGQVPQTIGGTTSVELYDPTAGTFTLAGNMIAPRDNQTATLLSDGRVLLAEGVNDPNAFQTGKKYAQYELYDPSTSLFTALGTPMYLGEPIPGPFDSIALANGKVLVDPGTIFDPTSNIVNSSTTNPAEGGAYRFILLPTNQVFAVGGVFSSPSSIYDPVSNQFAPTGNPQYVRSSPDAALLPNGEVLVAAGLDVNQVEFWVAPVPTPVPVITGVSPNPITGFNPVPITIQGANFAAGSVISLDGAAIPTTIVSETELTATIPAITLTVPGGHPILVQNGSGFISAPFTLTVDNPRLGVSQPNGSGISYGNIPGGSSSSQSLEFQNGGNAPLTIDSLTISGTNSADFKFDTANTTCPLQGGILTAQQVCTATVLFVPVTAGPFSATLNLAYEALPGSPFVVPLSGTGAGQVASTIAPTSLTFANQAVGTSSQAQSLTIVNTGNVNLDFSSVVLSDTTDFSMANGCPSTLNPSKSCAIVITFQPSVVGSISGTVVVTSNTVTPYTVLLSGTGENFSISPAAGSSASATVSAGQTATYQLSLSPQAFSGSVALTCAPVIAIPNAICSVTPNPATVNGTAATVITVSVATVGHSGMAFPSSWRKILDPGAWEFLAGPWLFYLLVWVILCSTGIKLRRIARTCAAALLLVVIAAGCTSSGTPSGGGGSTGTPTGTYQLLVTASAAGARRTITLTLKVQ